MTSIRDRKGPWMGMDCAEALVCSPLLREVMSTLPTGKLTLQVTSTDIFSSPHSLLHSPLQDLELIFHAFEWMRLENEEGVLKSAVSRHYHHSQLNFQATRSCPKAPTLQAQLHEAKFQFHKETGVSSGAGNKNEKSSSSSNLSLLLPPC